MPLKARLRILHRKFSPWFVPSVLLLASTGLVYRVGRAWFGMTKETGEKILYLHSGEWLGGSGSVIYLLLVGSALIFLIVSGLWMWLTSKSSKAPVRKIHRVLAVVFSLPLLITATTGITYQVGGKWLHLSEGPRKLLMSLHQGSWLGPSLRPFYVLLLGAGLIVLCITGTRLLFRAKPTPKATA